MKVIDQSYSIRWYGRDYKVDAVGKSAEEVVDEFNKLLKNTKVKVEKIDKGKYMSTPLIQIKFK